MASEQFHAALEFMAARPMPVAVAERRAAMEALTASAPLPDGMSVQRVDAGGIPAEWVAGAGVAADDAPVVFYLHGGAYTAGSLNTHRRFVALLSTEARAQILNVDYWLAPEHPHPAAVNDAVVAYRWLLDQGVPATRIALAGDSAGGGLTAATLLALRDRGVALPVAAVLISPWADLGGTGDSMTTRADADPMLDAELLQACADMYLSGQDARLPLASPIYGDFAGLPPLLIHVGDREVLLDDSTRLAERARAARVDVELRVEPGMIHVWHAFAGLFPEADSSLAEVGAWLQARFVDAVPA
jgi:acetyl esterase/lipase